VSRADELRALHAAELAVVELEDQLVAAKAGDGDLAQVKVELRRAREHYRRLRDAGGAEPAAGDGVARPATVETVGGVA